MCLGKNRCQNCNSKLQAVSVIWEWCLGAEAAWDGYEIADNALGIKAQMSI